MFLIPYEEVKGLKTIGVAKKSKYNKYEVTPEKLVDAINSFYDITNNLPFDTLNIPTNIGQQQEQQYRNKREIILDWVQFTNHDIEGLVYDFMIGNKKVQEKVGFLSLSFHL